MPDADAPITQALLDACSSSALTLQMAATRAKADAVRDTLHARATECAEAANKLRLELHRLRGEPAVAGDDAALLAECERLEARTRARYEEALAGRPSPALHDVIEKQYEGVLRTQRTIQSLRQQVAG